MTPELRSAVEKLYEVFAKYPLKNLEGCPCCVEQEELLYLSTTPLRLLEGKVIFNYGFEAMTTIGDELDFKHFLPRLFELLGRETRLWEPSQLAGKLTCARWEKWTQQEVEAIEDFWTAYWQSKLLVRSGYPEIEDVFKSLLAFSPNPDRFLALCLEAEGKNALLNVTELIITIGNRTGIYGKRFISEEADAYIKKWLHKPDLKEKMEKAFFRFEKDESSATFATAYDILSALL